MAECRDEKRKESSRSRDGIEWNESDGRERPLYGRVNDGEAVNERDDSWSFLGFAARRRVEVV